MSCDTSGRDQIAHFWINHFNDLLNLIQFACDGNSPSCREKTRENENKAVSATRTFTRLICVLFSKSCSLFEIYSEKKIGSC